MSNMNSLPTALDLFSGCGGISSGLRSAGFHILGGVDIEPVSLKTFRLNFPTSEAMELDLSQTAPESVMDRLGIDPGGLTLLAGGPPCQGFSKNVPRKYRFLEDPKNLLVRAFIRFFEVLRPQLVLMENVAEMKNGFDQAYTEEVVQRLEENGYNVTYGVLQAHDYGVPQRRRRAFFLARLSGPPVAIPERTHSETGAGYDLFPGLLKKHVSVWDAIGDLPRLQHGEGEEPCGFRCPPFSEFQAWAREGCTEVFNHKARMLQPTQAERLASISPGQGLKDLPAHLRPKSGYSGAYGRLTKEMVAPTVTRWVFHPGSGRFSHPEDPRVITIREAARLQGFPDSFRFLGTYIQQAHQVGNAVPPLLAEAVARALLHDSASCKLSSMLASAS